MLFAKTLPAMAYLWTVALASAVVTPAPSCTTCHSVTSTAYIPCPYFNTATCVRPACILLTTTVIPSKTCSLTATYTEPCVAKCPTGCGTATTTITASESCVPTSPSSCFTATTTSGVIHCPLMPVCTGGLHTTTSTVTRPAPNPYCAYTPTMTVPPTCQRGCTRTKTVTKTKSV